MALFTDDFVGTDGAAVKDRTGWIQIGATNQPLLNGSGGVRSVDTTNNGSTGLTVHNTGALSHYAESVVGSDALSNTTATCDFACVKTDVSGTGVNSGFNLNYAPGTSILRLRTTGTSIITSVTTTIAVGDTVRLEAQMGAGDTEVYLTGKVNGTTVIGPITRTSNLANTGAGFRAKTLQAQNPIIDSFAADALSSDVAAPTVSVVDLVATGSTTLTGQYSSDEVGATTAVLFLASQADPSDAQVLAGTDVNDDPAVCFLEDEGMVIGTNTLLFTGATASTAYKFKMVSRDGVPNVAAGVTSGSETTDALPQKATVTLYEEDGTTPAASITGLQWAWWDDATPDLSLAADVAGTGASTDASGVFDVTLTGTALTLGQTGTLLIYKTDGTAESTATLSFCGPLETVN